MQLLFELVVFRLCRFFHQQHLREWECADCQDGLSYIHLYHLRGLHEWKYADYHDNLASINISALAAARLIFGLAACCLKP